MLVAMLERIGYDRPVHVDVETLFGLHRAWRACVPYENLDIQLDRPIVLDSRALFDKLVQRRRGGWCFEQNGMFALLLESVGFKATLVESRVMRETGDATVWGDHCMLLVDAEGQRWVGDVGSADGFMEPFRLCEGPHTQGERTYRLERLAPGTWRFHNHPKGSFASCDFRLRPRALADFTDRSRALSTAPDSPFVTKLIVARPYCGNILLLLGRTLYRLGGGERPRTLGSVAEFADVLAERFLVPLDDVGPDGLTRLWDRAVAQEIRRKDRAG